MPVAGDLTELHMGDLGRIIIELTVGDVPVADALARLVR